MSSRTAAGRGAKLKHHTRKVRAKKLQERPLFSVNDPYFYNRNYFSILFPLLRLETRHFATDNTSPTALFDSIMIHIAR